MVITQWAVACRPQHPHGDVVREILAKYTVLGIRQFPNPVLQKFGPIVVALGLEDGIALADIPAQSSHGYFLRSS